MGSRPRLERPRHVRGLVDDDLRRRSWFARVPYVFLEKASQCETPVAACPAMQALTSTRLVKGQDVGIADDASTWGEISYP